MAARVLSRISRRGGFVGRLIASSSRPEPIGDGLHCFRGSSSMHSLSSTSSLIPCLSDQLLKPRILLNASGGRRFGFFSSASAQPKEKEASQSPEQENEQKVGSDLTDGDTSAQEEAKSADEETVLDKDQIIKLAAEREEQLTLKLKDMEKMQDKLLRSYAEKENSVERIKREAENSKKFAIQNFAKNLLDVADNLERASSVVTESFSKIDTSKDSAGAVPLLKTLLEGVTMTEKQLAETFKKFGVEKIDPVNEQFDPNRHCAVLQVPDSSKPPGTIAYVFKTGYVLHDRVIRAAEVGVVRAPDNEEDESSAA